MQLHTSPLWSSSNLLLLLATVGAMVGCAADSAQPATTAGASAPATASPAIDPVGTYTLPPPLVSELRITALPGQPGAYRIEMHGGGDPRDGAGVGADCEALAQGPLRGDEITAALLPFESDIGGMDASDLQAKPTMTLAVDGNDVVVRGTFAHCAMATAMAGRYIRTTEPKLWTSCPPLPAACWTTD